MGKLGMGGEGVMVNNAKPISASQAAGTKLQQAIYGAMK
jgi:hypothetical protein